MFGQNIAPARLHSQAVPAIFAIVAAAVSRAVFPSLEENKENACLVPSIISMCFTTTAISNLYVPDVRPVWRECFRVLRRGGVLLSSFYNPVVFVGDRDPGYAGQGLIRPRFRLPYSDIEHLDEETLADKQRRGEPLVFGHGLSEQIGGQLEAGFVLTGFHEDAQPQPRFVIDRYLPTFLATRACKS